MRSQQLSRNNGAPITRFMSWSSREVKRNGEVESEFARRARRYFCFVAARSHIRRGKQVRATAGSIPGRVFSIIFRHYSEFSSGCAATGPDSEANEMCTDSQWDSLGATAGLTQGANSTSLNQGGRRWGMAPPPPPPWRYYGDTTDYDSQVANPGCCVAIEPVSTREGK